MNRGNEIEIRHERAANRWRRLVDPGRHPGNADQIEREIDYVPMSRVLPSGELGAVRAAFNGGQPQNAETLNATSLEHLSYVLGRTYHEAETKFVRGLGLPMCRTSSTYCGFDMGAGECSAISLLYRLQNMPSGGLLLIEEIEVGLHAEAQARLVEVLLRICQAKRIQIICTTHSEVVLDHVPRQARILLRRNGDEHEAISNVSRRFAVHEMAGNHQPELLIYTEDRFAAILVEEALTGPHRSRVHIRDVGSNATLARQAVAHLRMQAQIKSLSAFDGDCTRAQIDGWISDERADRHDLVPTYLRLPGDNLNPERWILREIGIPEYRDELARELGCSPGEVTAHTEAMRVQLNQHDAGYILSQRTGLELEDARRRLIRSVARRHPQLDELRTSVGTQLDGD